MITNVYTKLFNTIIHSTVWREEMHVKVVWITMLAMADPEGDVWASIPGLADAARVSLDQCQDALARLSCPDPYSRTREHEGRRIVMIDGGWRLLNYPKYRQMRDAEHRRAQVREAVRRHRAGRQQSVGVKSDVISGSPLKTQSESESEEAHQLPHAALCRRKYPNEFETAWAAYPRRAGGNPKRLAFKAWSKRVRDGASSGEILAGVERYARYCKATGKEGTEYVKHAATFFGPEEYFREPWVLPSASREGGPRDAYLKPAELAT